MTLVSDVLAELSALAPLSFADADDPVGLRVGDAGAPVRAALVALDPSERVLSEAIERGADLVVTHHPFPYRLPDAILRGDPEADKLALCLSAGLNLIAMHTNLDRAGGGVNDALAAALGLSEITSHPCADDGPGMPPLLRAGLLPEALSPAEFAELVKRRLGLSALRARLADRPVRRVCVCGGAGGRFLADAAACGADAYVTGDVKHFTFTEAAERGLTLLDATHFATEKPICAVLSARLRKAFPALSILDSERDADPARSL